MGTNNKFFTEVLQPWHRAVVQSPSLEMLGKHLGVALGDMVGGGAGRAGEWKKAQRAFPTSVIP